MGQADFGASCVRAGSQLGRIGLGTELEGIWPANVGANSTQVIDTYACDTQPRTASASKREAEAIRRTPRGAGWRLHPTHLPQDRSRTR